MPVTTTDQLDALILLAKAIRAENRYDRWDGPGIKAAIGNVRDRSLADVMLAVARGADNPELDTPGAIGNPRSSAWDERRTDRMPIEPYDPSTFCGTCGQPEHRCRSNQHNGHEFVTAIDTIRSARRNQETR